LKQAVNTLGLSHLLNRVQAPLLGLIDCSRSIHHIGSYKHKIYVIAIQIFWCSMEINKRKIAKILLAAAVIQVGIGVSAADTQAVDGEVEMDNEDPGISIEKHIPGDSGNEPSPPPEPDPNPCACDEPAL
jgi:hypothetical protein